MYGVLDVGVDENFFFPVNINFEQKAEVEATSEDEHGWGAVAVEDGGVKGLRLGEGKVEILELVAGVTPATSLWQRCPGFHRW